MSPLAAATDAIGSSFVIIVTPDYRVFALWKPNSTIFEIVLDNLINVNSIVYKTRAMAGKWPGFTPNYNTI